MFRYASYSQLFSVFGYPNEALSLVFDMSKSKLHIKSEAPYHEGVQNVYFWARDRKEMHTVMQRKNLKGMQSCLCRINLCAHTSHSKMVYRTKIKMLETQSQDGADEGSRSRL